MIVLDTNVVSDTMRPRPDAALLAWLDAQAPSDLWLTSTVAAELMAGVARLPNGARRQQLAQGVTALLEQDFGQRVLVFDLAVASVYAELLAQRERAGRPISMADAQIAAVCLANNAALATRNLKDFADLGLQLHNPWGG